MRVNFSNFYTDQTRTKLSTQSETWLRNKVIEGGMPRKGCVPVRLIKFRNLFIYTSKNKKSYVDFQRKLLPIIYAHFWKDGSYEV